MPDLEGRASRTQTLPDWRFDGCLIGGYLMVVADRLAVGRLFVNSC